MDTLFQDLRYAARTLTRQKGFTLIAVLCLALGIGVNTVIFSCLNAILLRPFPYADPDALLSASELPRSEGGRRTGALSYADYVDYATRSTSFVSMTAFASRTFTLNVGDEPERVDGARVSASTFSTLGIAPALGRDLRADDDREGAPRVALIGYGLWERRFDQDPKVVGASVQIDGNPVTIVGVMPPDVHFPARADLWMPHAASPIAQRGSHYLEAIGRLKPGVTLEQARAELAAIGRQLGAEYPETNQDWAPLVTTLREREVGEVRPVLLIMQGAVGFVLLIACANVANLLLARATARQREIAIRTTLGAARKRIVRQLLTESVILALAGGALGALIAGWGLDLVLALIPRGQTPNWMQFTIDARVLGFTVVASVVTGIIFGLAPALQTSRPDLTDALKDGGRGAGAARQSKRLRSTLVVAEVALSLMLLVGASLMMKSFARLQGVDPGFDYRETLSMQLSFPDQQYDSSFTRWAALDRIVSEVGALPGVRGAAAVSLTPLSGANSATGFFLENEPLVPGRNHPTEMRTITPEYFAVMRIPLVRGRTFTRQEMNDSAQVIVINRTFATRHWPNEDPIGKRIRWGVSASDPLLTVVGVVGDVRQRQLGAPLQAQMYLPFTAASLRSMTLMVAAAGDPAALATPVRAKVREIAPAVPLFGVRTMRDVYESSMWQQRLYGALFASFAVIALVLAAAGVYSVIAYSVTQRMHEIGVRMALGAQRRDVFRLVVRGGVTLALIGVAVGAAGALATTRVLSSLLFGVSPTDPIVFGAMAALLLATAALASYLPARRAAALDPVTALRTD